MNRSKAVTYSLLAHVRNTSSLISGPLDVFVPLVKRALSLMNKDGIFRGKNICEINDYTKTIYEINFPLPVLERILDIIISDINKVGYGAFIINDDKSFSISNYTFTEFDEITRKRTDEITKLEELFQDFCSSTELEIENSNSIFSFLEKNKLSLSKYLSNTEVSNGHEYTAEVQFVDYFKNVPPVYELIKSLYLGSILSEYIEYKPSDIKMDIELLLDTNFIISLMDLNTPESTHTCNTLINIAKDQGYKLSILNETIDEIKYLLKTKSENFNKSFMVKKIYTEDIYNACERKELTKVDLERIIDNIESTILGLGIEKVVNNQVIREEALKSDIYTFYKEKRQSNISAKHDAIALYYVKTKRGRDKIKDFTEVNCWFVNNAISRNYDKSSYDRSYQPEIIKADDLLSIMWLSNPKINSLIPSSNIANIGLSSLISLTFAESLPKTSIIKEFEDNIQKYRTDNITDEDIVRVATRIADKQLTNIEELNKLADQDTELFVKNLELESKKQLEAETERMKALSKIVNKLKNEIDEIDEIKENNQKNEESVTILKNQRDDDKTEIEKLKLELTEKNEAIKLSQIEEKVKKWKFNSRIYMLVLITITLLPTVYIYFNMNHLMNSTNISIAGSILSVAWYFVLRLVYDRHFNHSNIVSYKETIPVKT